MILKLGIRIGDRFGFRALARSRFVQVHSILSTLHIHLDHDYYCLEVIVVAGKLSDLQELANTLISAKGVKHGRANWTTSGANL